MKRILVLLTALGFVLASCQLAVNNSGTLKVVLPGSSSRATLENSTAVRLQLTRNGTIVPIQGEAFIERALSGQTVSISGLAPGSGYVVAVSTGHRAGGETFYRTDLYASSDPFEISAGVDTSVSVTLDNSRLKSGVLEAAAASAHAAVLTDNLSFYYLKGANVLDAFEAPYRSTSGQSAVLGLGQAANTLWLNTATGIAIANGSSFDTPSMSDDTGSIAPAVTDSGRVSLSGGTSFSYYIGAGLTAGVLVGDEEVWTTMDDLLDFSPELKEKLQGQIFRGVAATPDFAVVSTSIGTFRVIGDMLNGSASDLGEDLTNGTHDGVSIEITPSDTSLLIGPVSAISNGGFRTIFGGTPKGLYAAETLADGAPVGGHLQLVAGTLGLSITQLATYPVAVTVSGDSVTSVFTAAYSANTRELLILKGTTITKRIAAFEGLPSNISKLVFYVDASSNLNLVVAGSDATVKLVAAELEF